jgi:glycosyltransferase involved in cell wall biosynthesis
MRVELAVIATHLAPAVGYGGVAESTTNLVRAWTAEGRNVLVCASDGSTVGRVDPRSVCADRNVEIQLYRAHWFKRWGFGLGALWRVPRACWRAETVYVSGIATWPTSLGAVCSLLLRRPYVVAPRGGLMTAHVQEIRRTKPYKWLFYRWITLPTLARALWIHAASSLEREGVRRLLPNSEVMVVPNGVDTAAWARAAPRALDSGLVWCFIGRIAPDKGILRFLRIWARLRRPGDRFLLVGNGRGQYYQEVRDLATECGPLIELIGYRDRAGVREALAACHVLVLPSGIETGERENFGNVVAEAFAIGRPVVVAQGLAWDGIEDAGIGLRFGRDDAGIMQVIQRVQAWREDRYAAMCDAARQYAEDRLDLRRMAYALGEIVTGRPPHFRIASPSIARPDRPSA